MNYNNFYEALSKEHPDIAPLIRHELYFNFIKARTSGECVLRHIMALIRDALYLLLAKSRPPIKNDLLILAACSLPTANGFAGLHNFLHVWDLQKIAGFAFHPRLRRLANSVSGDICSIRLIDIFKIFKIPRRRPLSVSLALMRHNLWRIAWRQMLSKTHPRAVFLHNDFDVMSSALVVAAAELGVNTYCVQHGLPTDEFFPCAANEQIVWGSRSADLYQLKGFPSDHILIAHGRTIASDSGMVTSPPMRICLLSQTHTSIYGVALHELLPTLALQLAEICAKRGIPFHIRLHPNEVGSNPYPASLAEHISMPQCSFQTTGERQLVIGFASTAMVDAAYHGHYVAGLSWPATASIGARELLRPALSVENADDIVAAWDDLVGDSLRCKWLQEQQSQWLNEIYAPPDRCAATIATLLEQLGPQ